MFNPDLQQGDILDNKELSKLFICGNMGGMRRSHKTNTLVIVSDHTKGLYDDKWVGNDKKNEESYLEDYHIHFLYEVGCDIIDNVAARCPNCHRKIHALKLKKDIKKLELAANQRLK